jgi:tripartite-type tricarboxylate transporter receptor subunit TctC
MPMTDPKLLLQNRALLAGCVAAFTLLSPLAPCAVAADAARAYPARPIRIIVLNTPGSGADTVARLIANKLTEAWGHQVVIDNRAGASGNIGTEIAARAAPDGYTLVMITSQQPIVAAMFDKLNYDLVRDFTPISLIASAPFILVVYPGLPVSTVKDLVALAKAKPGQLNYASAGSGTGVHLATELFKSMTGTNITHVPYKGAAPALTDTMAGQVQVTLQVATAVLPGIKSGKLKPLGVSSLKRTPQAPDLPLIADTVPGYEWSGWYGPAAPAGTPREIIGQISAELMKAVKMPEFVERLAGAGVDPIGSTPQEYAAYMRREVEKMRHVIKVSGARPD